MHGAITRLFVAGRDGYPFAIFFAEDLAHRALNKMGQTCVPRRRSIFARMTGQHALKQSVRGAQNGSSCVLTSRTAFLTMGFPLSLVTYRNDIKA
jgi:hypothetical protein